MAKSTLKLRSNSSYWALPAFFLLTQLTVSQTALGQPAKGDRKVNEEAARMAPSLGSLPPAEMTCYLAYPYEDQRDTLTSCLSKAKEGKGTSQQKERRSQNNSTGVSTGRPASNTITGGSSGSGSTIKPSGSSPEFAGSALRCVSSKELPEAPGREYSVGDDFWNACQVPIKVRWCDAVSRDECDQKGHYGYTLEPGQHKELRRNPKKTVGFLYWACLVTEGGRKIWMDSDGNCQFN